MFDNATGIITSICLPPEACTATTALLLTGYVQFASDGPGQPTAIDAENPTGALSAIGVQVVQTAPAAGVVDCFEQAVVGAWRYFCAVPVGITLPPRWSGRAELTEITGFTLATSLTDPTLGRRKVCRYTPVRDCHPAVGSTIWGLPARRPQRPQTEPPPRAA
ncbi:MAG: hypothetical protein IPQ21_03165 [Betaproteobacteria bacterium]|nr:hypothetical protein [Betaproteobacteria bacterium]